MKPQPMAILDLPCFTCKHFDLDSSKYVCGAFPAGIPREILTLRNDHTGPYPGDNGIRYERSTPAPQLPKRDRPLWA